MKISRRLIVLVLCLCVRSVSAQWHDYWPLSHYTSIPTSGNYSAYFTDLFYAVNERCEGTIVNYAYDSMWELQAGGFVSVPNQPHVTYAVDPLIWRAKIPQFIGLTSLVSYTVMTNGYYTRDPASESKRVLTTYTNGMWITNYVSAVVTMPNGRVVTNVINRYPVYTHGQYVTNTAYDRVFTNYVPQYSYTVAGRAFDLMMAGYADVHNWLTLGSWPYGNESWMWEATAPPDYELLLYMWEDYIPAPTQYWPAVSGYMYTQTASHVTMPVSFLMYDSVHRLWVTNSMTVGYTNYLFRQYQTTVGYTTAYEWVYTNEMPVLHATNDVAFTNTYMIVTNDTSYAQDALLVALDGKIDACITNYVCTSNEVGGTFDYFLSHAYEWVWDGTLWSTQLWTSALPVWTKSGILEYSHAGTNLYRKWHLVPTNSLIQPESNYAEHFLIQWTNTVYGWEVGDMGSEYAEDVVTSEDFVTDNPKYLAFTNQLWQVELASFDYSTMYETTLQAADFTKYWYMLTNNTPTNSLTNVTAMLVVTQAWVGDISGKTFNRNMESNTYVYTTVVGPNTYVYNTTVELPYYAAGDVWAIPLVVTSGVVRAFTSYVFSTNAPASYQYDITAEYKVLGWFLTPNKSDGLQMAVNWPNVLTNDITKAKNKLIALGYPVKLEDHHIGKPSMGPSGYYYPGGVLRPVNYRMGIFGTTKFNIADSGGTAYPVCLDYMTWDTLCAWPVTDVRVTGAGSQATSFPSMPFDITGDTLFSPDSNTLWGYRQHVDYIYYWAMVDYWELPYVGTNYPQTETLNITQAGVSQTANAYVRLAVNNSRPLLTTWAGPDLGFVTASGELPVTSSVVIADYVWKSTVNTFTDRYFVADIQLWTNAASTVVARPWLRATNVVISTSPNSYVDGAKIALVVSNWFELYTSDPMLTTVSLDDRYYVINNLKYTQLVPAHATVSKAWQDVYPDGITPGHMVTNVIPYPTYAVQMHAAGNWYPSIPIPTPWSVAQTAGGDALTVHEGTSTYTNWGAMPSWATESTWTLTDGGTGAGRGYPQIGVSFTPGDFSPFGPMCTYSESSIGGLPVEVYEYDLYSSPWFGAAETGAVSGFMQDGVIVHGNIIAGEWPDKLLTVIYAPSNVAVDVDLYAYIDAVGSPWSVTAWTNFTVTNTAYWGAVDVSGHGSSKGTFAGTNTTYFPLSGDLTTNMLYKYGTVSMPAGSARTVTNELDIYLGDMNTYIDWYNLGTFAGSYTTNWDSGGVVGFGRHDWDYTLMHMKPYTYQMQVLRTVRKPQFKYIVP